MQNIKKIKAFTLSEMIVVLILTSIVVGLAFSVLRLVQKQIFAIQQNYYKSTEINKLKTALWIDFNRYQDIKYNALNNELLLKNELDSVSYRFSEDYIVSDIDTFRIKLEAKQIFFNGLISKTNKVDAIKIKTSKSNRSQELFIFKKNDATVYIE